MNASAVHPLHSSRATGPRDSLLGTRCMQIATGPRPARGSRSMQAGGLAAQSVNVLPGVCLPPSRLLPDPLQREEQRVPLARDCRGPLAPRECKGWTPRTVMNNAGYPVLALLSLLFCAKTVASQEMYFICLIAMMMTSLAEFPSRTSMP